MRRIEGNFCARKSFTSLSFVTYKIVVMSLYIRFKRKNQTVFLHCEPSQTFASVKARLAENFGLEPANIVLFANDKKRELLDLATISDQEIKNDDIVYMCFPRETGSGFEDPSSDTLVPLGDQPGPEA
jgi:uncharacterized protein YcgL (UPF0745 family)